MGGRSVVNTYEFLIEVGGGAVLFSKSFLPVSNQVEEVVAGILIIIRAKFEKYKMFFINVYAPTNGTERVIFLNSIDTILQNCKTDEYVFLGGDLIAQKMNCWTGIMWSLMRLQVEYSVN